jgi:hypothetical protein
MCGRRCCPEYAAHSRFYSALFPGFLLRGHDRDYRLQIANGYFATVSSSLEDDEQLLREEVAVAVGGTDAAVAREGAHRVQSSSQQQRQKPPKVTVRHEYVTARALSSKRQGEWALSAASV